MSVLIGHASISENGTINGKREIRREKRYV